MVKTGNGGRLPLEGIRVVSLENIVQLPWTTMVLADMGAEVVRVESLSRLDTRRFRPFPENDPGQRFWDRSGWHHYSGRNKQSVTLDLQQPHGLELLKRLISLSDVLAENHRPDVLERLGLGRDVLRQIRPDLVVLRSSGFGQQGPWRQAGAFGRTVQPLSGLYDLAGFEAGGPVGVEDSYHDLLTGWNNALAVLMALHHRRRTGREVLIDMSMFETGVNCIGPALLARQMGSVLPGRMGNSHPHLAPHGCYPCREEDTWVAIAVDGDAQWEGLCRALGQPEWAQDQRYMDPLSRWQNRELLDSHIAAWTRQRRKYEVMHLLQEHGVPAGPVTMARDLVTDPHLRERGFIQWFTHPPERAVGKRPYPGQPYHFSGARPEIRFVPSLGEHNQRVFGELLGVDDDQLQAYQAEGLLGTAPQYEDLQRPEPPTLDEQVDTEQLAFYDRGYRELLGLDDPADGGG